jgi:2-amino-4-hydroxy-6-hydroxymethyldihydropteridine diphosphokinase
MAASGCSTSSAGPVALIALGSNLADPWRQLVRAAVDLAALGTVEAHSSLWLSDPVGGPPGQPPYLNAVVVLRPSPSIVGPAGLLRALHRIEARRGRVRRQRNAPRTLDLDLLCYGAVVAFVGWPRLPHPRMMERSFVLAPLLEVAPCWRHPRSGERAAEALRRLGYRGVRRTALSWQR